MLYSFFKQAKKAPTDQSSTFKALTNETTVFKSFDARPKGNRTFFYHSTDGIAKSQGRHSFLLACNPKFF